MPYPTFTPGDTVRYTSQDGTDVRTGTYHGTDGLGWFVVAFGRWRDDVMHVAPWAHIVKVDDE